jgi:hypothetical protein
MKTSWASRGGLAAVFPAVCAAAMPGRVAAQQRGAGG